MEPMPAALLTDMLAEELMCFRVENPDVEGIPLNVDEFTDPAGRNTVISGFHFDAPVDVHDTFAILVVTEWFDRERKEQWLFFGKHRGDLPLGRTVNTSVGPTHFPFIEIRLCLF